MCIRSALQDTGIKMHLRGVFFIIAFTSCSILVNGQLPTVQLPNGTIAGRTDITGNNKQFYVFQKIPFAQPPIGPLRFHAPRPALAWNGTLPCFNIDVQCYQTTSDDDTESEDCLYLSVYTPELPSNSPTERFPVMVYIYGGGFVEGSSMVWDPAFFIDYNVTVVTLNYRVGPFGFLSTQDSVIPGNNGLKDQQLAIRWVKENIAQFNGDPEKIVIFGQSAGAASATYQLLDPSNTGLFRGIIAESGSFLCPWAFQRAAKEIAIATAQLIDPSFNNSSNSIAISEFFMSRTAKEIDQASYLYTANDRVGNWQLQQGTFWSPVIEVEHEGAFVTQKMYNQLERGDVINVPIIIGINAEESIFMADSGTLVEDMATLDARPDYLVPRDMNLNNSSALTEMGTKIAKIYTNGTFAERPGDGIRFLSDTEFNRGVITHARIQANSTPIWFYQFSYHGLMGQTDYNVPGAGVVTHGEEVRYMWRWGFNSDITNFPVSDQITHYRLFQIFTDFAKYLDPTPNQTDILSNITWPTVNSNGTNNFIYLDINETLTLRNHPKQETYSAWLELYRSLGVDDFDTF